MKKIQIFGKCAKRSGKGGENQELGASLVEYGLLIALVALIAIPSVKILGNNLLYKFDYTAEELASGGVDP